MASQRDRVHCDCGVLIGYRYWSGPQASVICPECYRREQEQDEDCHDQA